MVKVGIDLVKVERVEKTINRTASFKTKTFAESELSYAKTRPSEAETLAGIFAAKEAFLKAIEVGVLRGIKLSEVVVSHNETGAPELVVPEKVLKKYNITNANISISHDGGIATAVCVVE